LESVSAAIKHSHVCTDRNESSRVSNPCVCNLERFLLSSVAQMMPETSEERKNTPIVTGVLDYFPLALAAVARLSKFGNDKHNLGQPLHWSRDKSSDHADCIGRHLADRGVIDPETQMSHTVEVVWRALALLEVEEEKRLGLPYSRGSR
jgi:hypothetical protein